MNILKSKRPPGLDIPTTFEKVHDDLAGSRARQTRSERIHAFQLQNLRITVNDEDCEVRKIFAVRFRARVSLPCRSPTAQ
ncbi:hypothetical protein [Bradyrhizobium canariense]|uniref:hypothetical protein n=1 Tax=Bradyrhizobium canariense TaxID=255045 RepID=UPI0011775EC0|nr:hypothetical protein [Bradyrhizobium canariense]